MSNHALKLNSILELQRFLEDKALALSDNKRLIVAISGAPGSGKSHVSQSLSNSINQVSKKSEVFSMDGFHYDDSVLKEKNLLSKKGALETFDVLGLKSFLERLSMNTEANVAVPVFDRDLELSRSSALIIDQSIPLIIAEGNYLLLKDKPWGDLQNYFDITVMIKSSKEVLTERLMKRWKSYNLNPDEIDQKVFHNDIPNGEFVNLNSIKPDIEIIN
jgi:pantothenate kinase|tara:strand:+ start:6452 stop:7105 length:654 start_codon:yes stop_codon:yes gene_type:complete